MAYLFAFNILLQHQRQEVQEAAVNQMQADISQEVEARRKQLQVQFPHTSAQLQ